MKKTTSLLLALIMLILPLHCLTCTVSASENDMVSISFTPIKPIMVIKDVDVYSWTTECCEPNCETCADGYFHEYSYAGGIWEEGNILTITYSDGTSINYTSNGEGGFYNADYGSIWDENISITDTQSTSHWSTTGTYSATFTYNGCSTVIPIQVVDARVYSENQSGYSDEPIKIPVYISGTCGILGFKINFSYDSSVITPSSVEYGDVVDYGLQDNIEGDSTPGNMCVYWSGTENVNAEGLWFYVIFYPKTHITTKSQIDISYSQADTFNENFEDVVLDCSPITITIKNDTYSSDAVFSLAASEVTAGNIFSVDVVAESVTGSGSTTITIPYDSQIFEYTGAIVNGVDASFDNSVGKLTVTISKLNAQNSGTSILTLSFKCSENITNGKYELNASITFNSEDAYCYPCTISVTGGNPNSTVVYADDIYALPGDTIEIPVMIGNNQGLMGFRLTFSYNPDLLTPVSVSKGADMTVGTLNDSITDTYTGSFDVLWNHTENFVTDGEFLLLTFTVDGNADYSTADIGITYTTEETFNESYEDVPLICNIINFSITNFIPVQPEITVIKPTEKFIFSESMCCSQITDLVSSVSNTTISSTPNSFGFYGTGSSASVSNSTETLESYTIVIKGDVNGDSSCDVLDTHALSIAINQHEALTEAELYSIDFNENGEADITDYQNAVNYMIAI